MCAMKKSSHILEQIFCGQIEPINREILGGIVFGNAEEMAVLNGIVHPEVKAHIKEKDSDRKKHGHVMFCVGSGAFIGRSL